MWTIQLFGGLVARSPERTATRFRTQKAASLLAYLAFHTRPGASPRRRETLIDLLWPEAELEAGRHKLSTELSSLRLLLESPGYPPGSVVVADRFAVSLNPATLTTDVAQFEAAIRQAQQTCLTEAERLPLFLQALELYHGTLLPGFYEEWIVPETTRLTSLFLATAVKVVPLLLHTGANEQAVQVAQRAVAADPLSEEAVQALLASLAALNQTTTALEAYRQFAQRLKKEWEEEPSEALQDYVRRLKQETASNREPVASAEVTPTVTKCGKGSGTRERNTVHKRGSTAHEPDQSLLAGRETISVNRLRGEAFFLLTATRFFRREPEIEQLTALWQTPRTRLVTLTGAGGTGKTRLALELAAHLVNTDEPFETGFRSAVFVPLADVADAERLFEGILRSLHIPPEPDGDLLDQLTRELSRQPDVLLILDNFEHLVEEGAERVRDLLARTPSALRCLVTSRQKLLIAGEQEFPLSPLATPTDAQTPAALLDNPSVALFVDRAQAVKPDFQLTDRNASVVAELCDRLEGIPLALELAAVRLQLLSVGKILEQIAANRLDFLATRRRDAVSRHRTLRATLDWSHHLLPPSARAFLMQLGVFRGGWTLEAAEAVCQIKHGETLEMLGLLRDNSLVGVVDTEQGIRFTLLETVREYACEQLEQTGQQAAVQGRHRDYFLALAQEADKNLSGAEQKGGFECLEAENANLRAALAWSLQNGDAESSALRLCDALWQFWQLRGYWREGREQLERALRKEGALAPIPLRSSALDGAGALARMQEDFEAARAYFEESLTLRKELGDPRKIAGSLNNLGVLVREQGDKAEARLYLEEALALNREIGNRAWEAANLNNLARIFDNQDNIAASQSYFEQALVINREVGNRIWEADDLQCLGNLARQQGRYPEARFYLEEALAINREISGRVGEAGDLELLGRVADDEGDHDQARAYLEEALAINREISAPILELRILQMLGRVEREQSHSILAAAYYEQASALCRAVRNPAWEAFVLIERGHLAAKSQETAQAQSLFQQAMHLFQKGGPRRRPDDSLETIAEFLETLVCLSAVIEPSSWGVRLLAAITAQRALRGKPLPPGRRSEIERSLALLRTALGDEVFDSAWAEGTALTLEEAIAATWEKGRTMTPEQAIEYALARSDIAPAE